MLRLNPRVSLLAFVISSALAQTCENYGTVNGTTCVCPSGFGGPTCSQPGCGGDIFQGENRTLVPGDATSNFANLTSAGCSCESGWGGFGCNICQSASACQTAFDNAGGSSLSSLTGQDDPLMCSNSAKVQAAGQMSCSVINPTLQAIFPGSSNLNILRTLQPALTPLPNITGLGASGSVFAQLWYEGVEQFYCAADSCQQSQLVDGSTNWECSDLKCTCRAKTTFCGGGGTDLSQAIDSLDGTLTISCASPANGSSTTTCGFQQALLNNLFGSSGLSLSDCSFGECVAQSVLDGTSSTSGSPTEDTHKSLSGGVIAGLAVIGALLLLALVSLLFGLRSQQRVRKGYSGAFGAGGVAIAWNDISYVVRTTKIFGIARRRPRNSADGYTDEKAVLDGVSGRVEPGQIMAILGPSGAGKTTLVEMLAGKEKMGDVSGVVTRSENGGALSSNARIAFVPQQDVLPATLTVREALLFAAQLRLPEAVPLHEKKRRVADVLEQLGLTSVADTRIGSGDRRGVSGGEMRRVSIGLELVGKPDALVLDEPTSGLDSVSAGRVVDVLRALAHDPEHPISVIASIHQPSSKVYNAFDQIVVLAHGRSLYTGIGGLEPMRYFTERGVEAPPEGYNVAEHLLDIASEPPAHLFGSPGRVTSIQREREEQDEAGSEKSQQVSASASSPAELEKGEGEGIVLGNTKRISGPAGTRPSSGSGNGSGQYSATFLTQLEVLSGREWKILRRDKTLFLTHVGIACVLGVFCGGLYFNTGITIAGFQSRVGCLFFLGALVAFSSLSALYNLVENRPLFLRERSNMYYSPTAWLLSRLVFDVIPLRLIPTIIVSTITYWMAGLASDPANFFKFLFILVLYSLAMTLFNFLLACLFQNGGIAILLSALTALYQMTFAGFFVHLGDIPPVLRWLQWLCPLKYTLEALSVNEVGSGLQIEDTLSGVPVDVSASLIMQLLFGFGVNNYYRDVLVHFAFIAGFGISVIGIVWFKMRERR